MSDHSSAAHQDLGNASTFDPTKPLNPDDFPEFEEIQLYDPRGHMPFMPGPGWRVVGKLLSYDVYGGNWEDDYSGNRVFNPSQIAPYEVLVIGRSGNQVIKDLVERVEELERHLRNKDDENKSLKKDAEDFDDAVESYKIQIDSLIEGRKDSAERAVKATEEKNRVEGHLGDLRERMAALEAYFGSQKCKEALEQAGLGSDPT